jgi:hypothetical protein
VISALVLDPYEFAGDATRLGIPHFWNVVTNAPFLLVGLLGLRRLRADDPGRFEWAGLWTSTVLLTFASGAYHVHPAPWSLALDRAAICGIIAFLGARAAHWTLGLGPSRTLSLALLVLAEGTVLAWLLGASPWLYGALQAGGGLAVLGLFVRAQARGTLSVPARPMLLFLGCYALAKVFEALDEPFWSLTGVMGGHPVKHLLSALGLACLLPLMRPAPRAEPA